MLIGDYDYETDIRVQREEAYEQGISQGISQGAAQQKAEDDARWSRTVAQKDAENARQAAEIQQLRAELEAIKLNN